LTLKRISPKELYEKMKDQENIVLLDVRSEEKYNDFHIEDSSIENLNIQKTDIFTLGENKEASITSLPKEKEIIVACTTGNSATKCATILSEREYDVIVLEGGITAWKEYLKTK
jgi:rhodanese-related sulfurtransferase